MAIVDRMRKALGLASNAPAAVEPETEVLSWPDGLPQQIITVEQACLDVYRQHGLPTAAGNYRHKGGPGEDWETLPEGLTPEEKWKLYLEAPEGAGWRFADRAALGKHSDIPEVRRASTLLQACDRVRQRIEGKEPVTPQDLADAVDLGTASGLLLQAMSAAGLEPAPDYQPLVFVPVEDDEA